MLITSSQSRSSARQRGFTLIELMVGMVVGLIVLSTAIAIYLMGVRGSTHAVRAAKLNQEMRTGMTLMVEDIRRAGYWGNIQPGAPNPFTVRAASGNSTDIYILTFNANSCILYSYDATYQVDNRRGIPDRISDSTPPPRGVDFFGFRLAADGALQIRHGGGSTNNCNVPGDNWERITDPRTVRIESLTISFVGSQCLNTTVDSTTGERRSWQIQDTSTDQTTPVCEQPNLFDTGYTPDAADQLVELREVRINMEASHVRDDTMRANITESVKVRNNRLIM